MGSHIKRGVNPLIASYRRLLIEEITAAESAKENVKMLTITKTTIRMMSGQVPVEFQVETDPDGMTGNEVKRFIDAMIEQGFTPPSQWNKDKVDNLGKRGTVTSITPVTGTKMFEVVGKLDDDAGEFKWREFTATTFRKGDRFEVIKNDRGFKAGQLIVDNVEQKEIPF